ncbi:MAG: hypothetical protein K8S98_05325 [Planctomycetes bacterium]|nr:hypothetical protein [Planctomycetota bacterium]
MTVPADCELQPLRALWSDDANSQNATVTSGAIAARDADGHQVTAVLRYGVLLNVVDAVSREHLKDITLIVARVTAERFVDTRHPPDVFLRDPPPELLASPILLPDRPGTRVAWVRAPGYAWTRFAFRGTPGSLTIPLSRGADVDVTVRHVSLDAPAPAVLVYAANTDDSIDLVDTVPLAARQLVDRTSAVFTGLPAGPLIFVVTPYPGARFSGPRLGQVERFLCGGDVQSIEIDLARADATQDQGSIHVIVAPSKWSGALSSSTRVTIERDGLAKERPFDDYITARKSDDAGRYHSFAPHLLVGDYVVALVPEGAQRRVTVVPGKESVVEFHPDRSAHVVLSILHCRDKRAFVDAAVTVRPSLCKRGTSWTDVSPNLAERLYEFDCEPGDYTLHAQWTDRQSATKDVIVASGANRFELELQPIDLRPIALRAQQVGGEVVLPLLFWECVEIRAVDGGGGSCVAMQVNATQVGDFPQLDAAGADFFVDRPGTYEVALPRLSGLRTLASLTVVVDDNGSGEQILPVEFE